MELLIIISICFVSATAACVWCWWDQKKVMTRYANPVKQPKKKPAKVVRFKIDELLALELDEKLNLNLKEMQRS